MKMWKAEGRRECPTYAKSSSFLAENQQIMSDVYQEIFLKNETTISFRVREVATKRNYRKY